MLQGYQQILDQTCEKVGFDDFPIMHEKKSMFFVLIKGTRYDAFEQGKEEEDGGCVGGRGEREKGGGCKGGWEMVVVGLSFTPSPSFPPSPKKAPPPFPSPSTPSPSDPKTPTSEIYTIVPSQFPHTRSGAVFSTSTFFFFFFFSRCRGLQGLEGEGPCPLFSLSLF